MPSFLHVDGGSMSEPPYGTFPLHAPFQVLLDQADTGSRADSGGAVGVVVVFGGIARPSSGGLPDSSRRLDGVCLDPFDLENRSRDSSIQQHASRARPCVRSRRTRPGHRPPQLRERRIRAIHPRALGIEPCRGEDRHPAGEHRSPQEHQRIARAHHERRGLAQNGEDPSGRNAPGNFCARWSSAEFIALFPEITESRLHSLAEKLRSRIQAEFQATKQGSTASIGIAFGDKETIHELIQQADRALENARQSGGNRVEGAASKRVDSSR